MPRRRYRRNAKLFRRVRKIASKVAYRTALRATTTPKISLWQSYSQDPTSQNLFPSFEQTNSGIYWYSPWHAITYSADERSSYQRSGPDIMVTRFEIHFYVDGEVWNTTDPHLNPRTQNTEIGVRLTVLMDRSGGRASTVTTWPYALDVASKPDMGYPITSGGQINDTWIGGPTIPVGRWLRDMEDCRIMRDRWWRIQHRPTGTTGTIDGAVDRAGGRFQLYKKWVWKYRRGLRVSYQYDNATPEPIRNQLLIKIQCANNSQDLACVVKTYFRDHGH